jgi:thymidylate synthase (FAD)
MRVIKPSIKVENTNLEILQHIERAGRTCYKSEEQITANSAVKFIKKIIERGHESVLEHVSISVRVICDRGVSHEIVRHRIASYSQESTRYCNYAGQEMEFIQPCWFEGDYVGYSDIQLKNMLYNRPKEDPKDDEYFWLSHMHDSERHYEYLIISGWSPQQARSVLPNSLKTEIVMTMNIREWRHFFKLRCSKAAHPQMQEVANMIKADMQAMVPVIFDD